MTFHLAFKTARRARNSGRPYYKGYYSCPKFLKRDGEYNSNTCQTKINTENVQNNKIYDNCITRMLVQSKHMLPRNRLDFGWEARSRSNALSKKLTITNLCRNLLFMQTSH